MSDHLPRYGAGAAVTLTASAAITAAQLVTISGDLTVAPTTAGAPVRGVAARDAASGDRLLVHRGGVHTLTAAENIAAGALVQAGAAGKVALWEAADAPVPPIGIAEEAVASNAAGRFLLFT